MRLATVTRITGTNTFHESNYLLCLAIKYICIINMSSFYYFHLAYPDYIFLVRLLNNLRQI